MPRRNHSNKQMPILVQMSVCHSKRRYANKLAAERAAELKNLEDMSLELSVYQCASCKGWHLTRQQAG